MNKICSTLVASALCLSFAPLCAHAESSPASSTANVKINQNILKSLQSGRRTFKRYRPSATAETTLANASASTAPRYAAPPTVETPPSEEEVFIPLAKQAAERPVSKKEALSKPKTPKVRSLGRTPPPFSMWEAKWSGRANIGASVQKGNGKNQNIDADGTATALWDNKDRVILNARIGYQEDKDQTTVDEREFSASFNDYINDKTYLDYDTRLEKDDVAGVDFRATAGLGVGYQAFDHPNLKVRFSGGLAYLLEEMAKDQGDEENEKTVAYNWKFDFERKLKNTVTTLYHNHRLIVPAENNNDYVFTSNSGIRIPLRSKFIASFDVRYDIDEGVEDGFSQTDTKYSVKLGYEW